MCGRLGYYRFQQPVAEAVPGAGIFSSSLPAVESGKKVLGIPHPEAHLACSMLHGCSLALAYHWEQAHSTLLVLPCFTPWDFSFLQSELQEILAEQWLVSALTGWFSSRLQDCQLPLAGATGHAGSPPHWCPHSTGPGRQLSGQSLSLGGFKVM